VISLRVKITNYQLPITNYQLPITHYQPNNYWAKSFAAAAIPAPGVKFS
jgi:hypothetical protein